MGEDVELRSELWRTLKTMATQHPSTPPSIITASALEARWLDSLAARISTSPGFCQERAAEPARTGRTERWEEVAIWLFWRHSAGGVSVLSGSCDGNPRARTFPSLLVLSRCVSCIPPWQLSCLQVGQAGS